MSPTDSERGTSAPDPARDRVQFAYLALVVLVCLAALVNAALGPIRDYDSYWHVLLGQNILAGSSIADAARGWTFAPVDESSWLSGQWLAEIGLAALVNAGGWSGLILWRVISTALVLVVLAVTTLHGRNVRGAVWPFLIAASMATLATQERSQQVSFILAPLVGWWGARLLRSGLVPRWWVVMMLCALWSNVHGGWVLLPVTLALAALARALDLGWRDRAVGRGLLVAALATVSAAASPSGFANITAFLRFRSSAAPVTEWQPVVLWSWDAVPFLLLVVLLVLSWARGQRRPTRGELLLVLVLLGFGLSAWRNMTPVALLLAPLTADIVCESWGLAPVAPSRTVSWWRDPRIVVAGAVGAVVFALTLALGSSQSPLDPAQVPGRLMAQLHATTSPQRVLNTYNVAGATLFFAGPPPGISTGIDGRADLFGSTYITDYQLTLLPARPGWEPILDRLDPTAALLDRRQGLVLELVEQRHWVEVGREADFVLLRAPDAPGWPST